MTTRNDPAELDPAAATAAEAPPGWMPMAVVAMAQILMSFNVNALSVSIRGIVASFGTAPTTVGTAIVTYSLFVAAFVMLGARVGARLGARPVFRAAVLLFGAAMAIMALSPGFAFVIAAQAMAGAAAAALVPVLVVLIVATYRGRRQAQALGWLSAAEAVGGVLAFLIAGSLGTWLGWRYSYGLLVALAGGVFLLGGRLPPVPGRPDVAIDKVGTVLAAAAIILVSLGFNNLHRWGPLLAKSAAPFSVLGLSPAPVLIVAGIALGQAFLAWSRRRAAAAALPLIALEVVATRRQRSAVMLMFVIVVLGAAVSFLIPLYIQIVQGRSSLRTALAIIPFSLAIFVAAALITRLYDRLTAARIAQLALLVAAAGLVLLAVIVRNEWETATVVLGLIVVGLGVGALATLLLNVLAAASPPELAGDVGSLRGTANNLAGGIGTALAGVLLVGVLSANITASLADNPLIPAALTSEVDLDNVTFVDNDRLLGVLERTSASPAAVAEAVRINTAARLRSLKITLCVLAALAILAVFPASGLSDP